MLIHLATAVLSPLLLAQGLHVRRSMVRLPEPAGERQGMVGTGPVLRVLILGDSAAAGVGADTQTEALLGHLLAEWSPNHEVHYRLLAGTGDRTEDALQRLADHELESVDVVVTSLGVNDVTGTSSLKRFVDAQQRLVNGLRKDGQCPTIVFSGLPPMSRFPGLPQPLRWVLGARAQRFDRALKQLCDRLGVIHLTSMTEPAPELFASDGFHPSSLAYREWARQVVEALQPTPNDPIAGHVSGWDRCP